MRKVTKTISLLLVSGVLFTACKKTEQTATDNAAISADILAKIQSHGFSTSNVLKTDEGYIVEGDITLTNEFLNETPGGSLLRIANNEQYRTTNLVKKLPRTITISISGLGTAYVQGTDLAIARYNAENLQIKFQRVARRGDIDIVGFNQGPSGGYITLGSSGFPTKSGEPYRQIKMNTNQYAYGSNPDVNYVGSVIQHEIGHCIGFRHTDYMDRSFSCGGSAVNEGASNVGAILIPGTPSGPVTGSWMLSCSDGGNRTFNSSDITALNYLY